MLLTGLTIDTSRAKSNAHVVSMCAQRLRMVEFADPRADSRPCDIYWHNVAYADMRGVVRVSGTAPSPRVNRFPGMAELARKTALTQAVRSMKRLFPNEYRFYPDSWVLPAQLDEFRRCCAMSRHEGQRSSVSDGEPPPERQRYYIVKPDDGAQGDGIYIVSSPDELRHGSLAERQLVQEYIADPYLLADGLKFDFRVYAVIKSINPLSIYIAREGMARFCTERYAPPIRANFSNLYAHLTNYSLNKANNAYVHSQSLKDQLQGSKRLLSTVFHQMQSRGVDTRRLWREIKAIVVRTVLAMVPEIMLHHEHYFGDAAAPQCFQIMGFDIIVRADGVPLLLEVNAAPSLSVEHNGVGGGLAADGVVANGNRHVAMPPPVRSIVDEMIKVPLVHDCLLLVFNRLEQHQYCSARADNTNANVGCYHQTGQRRLSSTTKTATATTAEDDLGLLRRKRKPHLSEIFPGRNFYGKNGGGATDGADCRHLLILDRAVYLFMQCVNVRQTMSVSFGALKSFVRKCQLTDVVDGLELERLFSTANATFGEQSAKDKSGGTTFANGLCFHAFLHCLFHLARIKFAFSIATASDDSDCPNGEEASILPAFLRLLAYCDATLRYYGVRSARLRRAEFELNGEPSIADQWNDSGAVEMERSSTLAIYLLPNRMRHHERAMSKAALSNTGKPNVNVVSKRRVSVNAAKAATSANRSRSMPAVMTHRQNFHQNTRLVTRK